MAEEEHKQNTEEAKDEQAPEAEAEQQPEAEAKADEQPEAEAKADEQPEAEAKADEQPAAEERPEVAGPDEMEGLDWKARRRLERSRRPAESRPERKPADRAAERAQQRAAARKARSSYRRKRRQGGDGTGTPPADRRSVARKVRQGRVVSDRADKTITVRIDVAHRHPTYEKIVRNSSTLRAHDERNEAGEGDLVRVVETRPLSRHKRWRLVEVMERAK